jgi:LmbE family N-acetylglucosaminyl deacetylase
MNLRNIDASIFVPDHLPINTAIERTTHLAVSAHQDDLEIMAYDGIIKCYEKENKWFCGIVVTNGTGSVRTGRYSDYTDHEFKMTRYNEQIEAARIGKYGAVALLDYTSKETRDPASTMLTDELYTLISLASPNTVYVHNLADKHPTHVATALRTIEAIRRMPKDKRPENIYGCEVWRSLDWMLDEEKTIFDVDANTELAWKLLNVFESQISGSKKYDKATLARRMANSTFLETLDTDTSNSLIFAMDLSPLVKDEKLDISNYVEGYIERFKSDVISNIKKMESSK